MDYSRFFKHISQTGLAPFADHLSRMLAAVEPDKHGDYERWQQALNGLPQVAVSSMAFDASAVRVGQVDDCDASVRQQIEQCLRGLHPWRKGPFELCGVHIDTEWRSDWKWDRLAPHIDPLHGRTVLDIGCGSGYHLWRMLGAGAAMTIGVDPSLLFQMQLARQQTGW